MILYLLLIGIAILCISVAVALIAWVGYFPVLAYTSLATVAVIAVDGLTATVCRLLPKRCANHEKNIFQVSAKEKRFYEKLKIRKWKDRIPEIGQFTGFRKNKLENPNSLEYVDRFLMEICYGQIGHAVSVFTSFLILLFYPLYDLWLAVAIPVAIVSALLNLPSFMVLRYNSYKLRVLRKSLVKKQAKSQVEG